MRVAAVALVVALALTAASPVAVAQSDGLSTDGVAIDVYVAGSGDATWNVSTAFALDSDEDREAFRRLADDVENGSDPPGFDVGTAEALVESAEQRTDREMSLDGVRRTARVTDNGSRGVVTFSFTWRRFAATNGDTIAIGDAFGAWSLTAEQRLSLHRPSNYGLLSVTPDADSLDNGSLTWTGETDFGQGEPAVVYTRSAAPPTTTPATPPDGADGPDLGFLAAVSGALLLGGLLAYAAVRRDRLFGDEGAPDDATGESAAAATATDESAAAEREPDEDAVDPALLSDEERVERLLADRGGRMKQATIVSETGWSNAKVSQLLSSMEEDGRIEKLRIGRENLISLPGAEDGDESEE